MQNTVAFVMDGECVTLDFSPSSGLRPTTTVLNFLRSLPGHKGVKEGCAEGDCGACTVVLAEAEGDTLRYHAVDSCLMFLPMLHGKQLITVENLKSSDGGLHPVQRAMVEVHGSQCGFCTPGVVMSLFALYKNPGTPGEEEIRRALAGNLCRCTGYTPIIESAARACAGTRADHFTADERRILTLLRSISVESIDVSTADQRYLRPATLLEALTLRQNQPDAVLINGATDIALRVTKNHELIPTILDLSGIRELQEITEDDASLTIGAGISLERLFEHASERSPVLASALELFGSRQIRTLATLGGNLGTASPVGDMLPILIALKAEVVLQSSRGMRHVPASEFVMRYRKTACAPDELITAVVVLKPGGDTIVRFYKISRRRDMDIATVSGGFRLERDSGNRVRDVILAYGGMADRVKRAPKTEAFLSGRLWNRSTVEEAMKIIDGDFEPISDVRGSAAMRRLAARNLLMKFWADTHGSDRERAGPPPVPSTMSCTTGVGMPHESAELHVTGEAVYVDDIPASTQLLVGRVVTSPHAHARVASFDLTAARTVPGVHAVFSSRDIPGENQMGPVVKDEPCLAEGEVTFVGQAVFLIAAETEEQCREAERLIQVAYEPLDAILRLDDAMARQSVFASPRRILRGNPDEALRQSPHVISGELRTGAQEHWYLESQVCLCVPGERNDITVHASSQNPSETQSLVAEVLGVKKKDVVVEVRRIGGGFGGKETQANHVACWAALLTRATGRPVKIRLFRDDDMIMTGKRHRFLSRYEVGFDDDGRLLAAKFDLNSDAGAATDLSHAIMERSMLHADNAYHIPHMSVTGSVWKTNLPSNTAFRGFGGPQGMALIEAVIDRVARVVRRDSAEIRRLNFYGATERAVTHYRQIVENNRLPALYDQLIVSAAYRQRRQAVDAFNAAHEFSKKGLALTPVKFGISFTTTFLNQAGALVLVYDDGTILVNHGGTEMGQGLHTKILQIAATEFGVDVGQVKVTPTVTDKVPNTPPTAASSGTDMNGAAVKIAVDTIKERVAAGMASVFSEQHPEIPSQKDDIVFQNGEVIDVRHPDRRIRFTQAMGLMRLRQVSLSATGFYRTPKISWEKKTFTGRPFYYYAFGMAVTEVLLDTLTGHVDLLRTDILHDVGDSINTGVDEGQIRGGYIQGVGWVTTEEIMWDDRGRLMTHSPDTYKIPTANDIPRDFRVALLQGHPNPAVIGKSKAVGEPPFMLGLSAWLAIKDAVSAVGGHAVEPQFSLPATNEVILLSIEEIKKKLGEAKPEVVAR